ncbi:MAG: tetratricopeptide repeat protein [Pirellulaceae bacterium]|nr:tetratricopeptide repeat protein [Pirellulaceae bacterium]
MERSRRYGVLYLAVLLSCMLSGLPRQSHAQPMQSPQEALLLYRDAANFQNNNAFELAAEEWERFLKRYPDDPLIPKAQHYLGICMLQLKQYQKAADAFQVVVAKHPEFEAIQDAYLNLGWCQYTLAGTGVEGMYAKAAETFAALVKKHPEGKYTDQATFFMGEAEYNQGNREAAVKHYARMVEAFPESSLRADALYALGVTYEELEQYADAGKIYDLYLKDFSEHPLAAEVRMRKAETVLQAGEHAAAAAAFGEVAALPEFASADHALYRQAFCLAKLDQLAPAADLYAKIATDYKQSTYVADSVISAGRCYYRAEQFPAAAKWFQTALDAGGKDAPEAAHWLSRIALKDGNADRALKLAKDALPKAAESEYLAHLKMDQADALYESEGGRAEAMKIYLAIATDHPKHELAPQSLYNAAFAALELKQYDDAVKHAEAFLAAYPEDRLVPDVRYVAAESHLQLAQYERAEAAYRELIDGHAQHPEIGVWTVRLGLAMYLQKKYDAVVTALQPIVEQLASADAKAEAQYLIGASQFFSDKFDPAMAALAASLKAAPKWRQADETTLLLARAQRAAGQLDEAIKTVKQMMADFPQSRVLDQAHYRHAEYAYAAEDYATAASEYEAVVTGSPQSPFVPFAVHGKGWSQLKAKQYEPAIASFTSLITDHAEHALVGDSYYARALSRRQAGQYEGAIEDLDAFLKTDPDLAAKSDALYERGLAQVALKQWPAAAATFQQLLEGNTDYAYKDKVLYEVAWAYKSMDEAAKQAEAIPWFARLAKESPDSPLAAEAMFHVGESLYEERKFDEAAASYTAAKAKVEAGELAEKILYKLGWSQFQLKKYDEALAQFTDQAKSYAAGPLASDAALMKAECLFRLEDYKQALPAYEALEQVKLSSPSVSALALLHGGQSASQLSEWKKAIGFFERLLKEYADSPYVPEAQYELAYAQQNSGDEASALKNYELAADASRGALGARARFMIGELLFGKKDYVAAVREFQRVMFGFGGDSAADDVKPWQAKAAFEAARCSEVQVQDAAAPARAGLVADAKKFYQYVVDKHPQHELVAQAKTRLQALSKL